MRFETDPTNGEQLCVLENQAELEAVKEVLDIMGREKGDEDFILGVKTDTNAIAPYLGESALEALTSEFPVVISRFTGMLAQATMAEDKTLALELDTWTGNKVPNIKVTR